MSAPSRDIVIAGNAPVDLILYPPASGKGTDPTSQRRRLHRTRGGASLLVDLLENLQAAEHVVNIHKPAFSGSGLDTIHSITELESHLHTSDYHCLSSLRLRRRRQVNEEHKWHSPQSLPQTGDGDKRSIWIFQDAEGKFNESDSEVAIKLFTDARPSFLLYHMARPLCSGKIWETVRRGTFVQPNTQDPKRLIVIISADDLRAEGIELSYGLSWEKTCEDFVEQLGAVGRLITLVTCAHLVVVFGCDGVIYHRGMQVARPTLFYDPSSVEGDFLRRNLGYVPGVAEAFVAGFAKALSAPENTHPANGNEKTADIEGCIKYGLCAARRLARYGLSLEGDEPAAIPTYRASQIMGDLDECEKKTFIRFSIPSDDIGRGNGRNWSLIEHTIGNPAEVARQIVKEGVISVANQVPFAQFNHLTLFDRHEIESFRTLFNLLAEYLTGPKDNLLSIALFGPRGSGKSFAALQVAEAASKGHKVRYLRFDLSQFTQLDDLVAAFHSIRDCSLEGYIPIVYFNGFDANFSNSPFGWLVHLLPSMLGGKFSDRGVCRPIGPAVIFWGASVVKTYEEFHRKAAGDGGKLSRAREFLGCLHGFVNMLGPDYARHRDGVDMLYPVRRAVILRSLLSEREPKLKSGESLSVDENVLNALLLVPTYRHGIRSLKSIIAISRLNGRRHFERSALPPPSQIHLHVDYDTFVKHMGGVPLPDRLREELAEKLHITYLANRRKMGIPGQEPKQWNELDEELKESSRAHAESIPHKLHLISCFLSEKQEYRVPIKEFTEEQIEFLAEYEHDRWNTERLQKQWTIGELDPKKRTTPFLVPWEDLEPKWRDVDRVLVASYPSILPESYAIYRLGPKETSMLERSK